MLESLTLPKLGVKGQHAEPWLREQNVEVPSTVYETRRLADGGLIARLGSTDFFLEGAATGDVLPRLTAEIANAPPEVYRVERHEATFRISGTQAVKVLAQLCSLDFRSASPGRVVLTRAGGVNCAVLPELSTDDRQFRFWVDCTYAVFFGETLANINRELGDNPAIAVPRDFR